MTLRYFCCDEQRREVIRQPNISLNGIDYLEVLDQVVPDGIPRQQILLVRCFKPVSDSITTANIQIEGGERIKAIRVLWAVPALSVASSDAIRPEEQAFLQTFLESVPDLEQVLVIRTDSSGDFSTYRLSLMQSSENPVQPENFDPILRTIDFSFKVECPSEFDCKVEKRCPPETQPQPDINYLAKDYASFRQLMLDRMAQIIPQWQERNPADLGMVLVELLAYVGDRLSYEQDAVATEAYLETARRRISVRRHARLMDYFMHDGCNARTWVQIQVESPLERPSEDAESPVPQGTQLLTRVPNQVMRIAPSTTAYESAIATAAIVFETVLDVEGLYPEHNRMHFYTWGALDCCLPKGATQATLQQALTNLKVGDILIFEEIKGSRTNAPEDANPTHRHAVRLTDVQFTADPLFTLDADDNPVAMTEPDQEPIPLTQISWHEEDALPFPLCISTATTVDISVALGNIVLADHGLTIQGERLRDGQKGAIPQPRFTWVEDNSDRCDPPAPINIPPRFTPQLQERSLTQAVDPFQPEKSASTTLARNTAEAQPVIQLQQWDLEADQPDTSGPEWMLQQDLLSSRPTDAHFMVEQESDGTAFIRFDPQSNYFLPGTGFVATYRIGNGIAGNIGADALAHIVTSDTGVIGIRNPLPGRGGQEPETIEEVRQKAPYAYRTQERAVTPEDYARLTERYPGVQQAAATLRWTGIGHTVFVTVDRIGGQPVDPEFEQEIRQHLEQYRMAGHDVKVEAPIYVSLELELLVCAEPDYFRSDVKKALLEVFSDRTLPDGQRGVFHPDNWTFGQPVYLSRLYAAAHAVKGVASVEITVLQRQGKNSQAAFNTGRLNIERLEIVRLANNSNRPEAGELRIKVEGGK